MKMDLARVIQRLIRRYISRAAPPIRNIGGEGAPPVQLPADHQAAMSRLTDYNVVNSYPFLERDVAVSRANVPEDFLRFIQAFTAELKRRGMPFFVHCIFRDRDTQNRLQAQGVTRARWGQSAHNYSMAVDIVHYGQFWDLTELEWNVVGAIGKEIARKRNLAVTWGGDWSFYDPAHWELSDWRKRTAGVKLPA